MESPRLLAREDAEKIINRVMRFVPTNHEGTSVVVQHWWNGELRWARNRVSLASDRRDIQVKIFRVVEGAGASATTNQLDEASLEATVRAAERSAWSEFRRTPSAMSFPTPVLPTPNPTIWSDATYNVTAEQRGEIARLLARDAEAKGLLSAGYIEMRAGAQAMFSAAHGTSEKVQYVKYSQGQCSVTTRHPTGVGSGWAGLSSYDWSAIDGNALAKRALDKCVASLNPVAIEPGRYTVVLEPQAVCDVVDRMFMYLNMRAEQEKKEVNGPFSLGFDSAIERGRTKLGLRVVDERISISHDPMDPILGILPVPGSKPITWIDHGVLTKLSYDRWYALGQLNDNLGELARDAYRMSGGESNLDEMVRTTKRGLLVTRFSSLMVLDGVSVLTTGVTRDGLWLIENGQISKAVKNLRITESPLFMLNQVELLGKPVPVFRPVTNPYSASLTPAIVPPIKAKDFSFTATVDAV